MRYVLFLVVAVLVSFVPQAQAADLSASLARMDAIIKEMQTLRTEFAKISESVPVSTVALVPAPAVLGAQSQSFFTQSLAVGETKVILKKFKNFWLLTLRFTRMELLQVSLVQRQRKVSKTSKLVLDLVL
jgi:hypothetical protein